VSRESFQQHLITLCDCSLLATSNGSVVLSPRSAGTQDLESDAACSQRRTKLRRADWAYKAPACALSVARRASTAACACSCQVLSALQAGAACSTRQCMLVLFVGVGRRGAALRPAVCGCVWLCCVGLCCFLCVGVPLISHPTHCVLLL